MDDYDIADDFSDSRRLVIAVAVGEGHAARAQLQPAFPGTLTFKPAPGQVPALDPASPSSAPLLGTLVLELSEAKPLLRLQRIPHFGYPVLLAYENVTLTPDFFATVVAGSTPLDPHRTLGRRASSAQKTLAFAKGQISIDVSPTKSTVAGTWPSLTKAPGSTTATLTVVFGVRTHLNPLVPQPSTVELSYDELVDAPEFVPMPLAFFYGMLRRRGQQEWNDLAAADHAEHKLFGALDALENASVGRWRRLRLFLLDPPTDTSLPEARFETVEARANDASATEIWREPLNRLGELFVKRPDNETFQLTVVDTSSGSATTVPLTAGDPPGLETALSLTWTAPRPQSDAGLQVFADLSVDGDPTDATLFDAAPLLEGMRDQAGITVDPIAKAVFHGRRLVRRLQQLLNAFGFTIAGAPRSDFDRLTTWALKEFQCYAGLTTVATKRSGVPAGTSYAESLKAATNSQPYTGPISGALDAETAAALRAWRENNYLCPVVVDSWSVDASDTRDELLHENIWLASDDRVNAHRMYVRDVSTQYQIPLTRSADAILLGKHHSLDSQEGPLCSRKFRTSWTDELPVTLDALAGTLVGPPRETTTSTYRVIAAVAAAENEGVFDVLNGYDLGVLSLGILHWTVFIAPRPGHPNNVAELPAFLAYLKFIDPDEFTRLFGRFGIGLEKQWPPSTAPVNLLFVDTQAKWATRARLLGVQASSKDLKYPSRDEQPLTRFEDANYLRNWHWFYRWVMAARTSTTIQRLQWDFARIRLRALLATPWHDSKETKKFTDLKKVFSSERGAAALLRAHVNQPGDVVDNGRPHKRLLQVVRTAGLTGTDPAIWTPDQVRALNQALETELKTINRSIRDTLDDATGYVDPHYGALSEDARSMKLDESGIETLR